MSAQFRVVYKREGALRRKVVVVARRDTAEKFLEKITGQDSEDLEGLAPLPPLEYARVEWRPVGAWSKMLKAKEENL